MSSALGSSSSLSAAASSRSLWAAATGMYNCCTFDHVAIAQCKALSCSFSLVSCKGVAVLGDI